MFAGSQGGTLPSKSAVFPLLYPSGDPREPEDLIGNRCWTLAHPPNFKKGLFNNPDDLFVIGDSGAFSHSPQKRWSFAKHLQQVFAWEKKFSNLMGFQWQFDVIASYDLLIDEVWVEGSRVKRRWSVGDASEAVDRTVEAARFLVANRDILAPRKLLLGCQGVDTSQYKDCVLRILEVAAPNDWIGLGGWCILGNLGFKHYLFEFYKVLNECLPLIAENNVKHVHLFGVRYEPAVAAMQFACDRLGLTCSTDSSRFLRDCSNPCPQQLKKSGAKRPYWRDNASWWEDMLNNLDRSYFYQQPSRDLAEFALTTDAFVGKESRLFLKKLLDGRSAGQQIQLSLF